MTRRICKACGAPLKPRATECEYCGTTYGDAGTEPPASTQDDLARRLGKWFLIALLVAFVMWNPVTRQIVLFILPLGSGIDDLVFITALVVAIIIWVIRRIIIRTGGKQ
ncbi:MAG: hypothetical protein ACLFU8_18055 [Anaerolineales bacterium]